MVCLFHFKVISDMDVWFDGIVSALTLCSTCHSCSLLNPLHESAQCDRQCPKNKEPKQDFLHLSFFFFFGYKHETHNLWEMRPQSCPSYIIELLRTFLFSGEVWNIDTEVISLAYCSHLTLLHLQHFQSRLVEMSSEILLF